MSQLVSAAILHQQMPANEIRQTRTLPEAIVSRHRATWSEFDACEEIADLLKRSAVLQGETHQAGNDIVETDQFRRTVRTFHAQEDFCWLFVIMDADVEGALAGDFDAPRRARRTELIAVRRGVNRRNGCIRRARVGRSVDNPASHLVAFDFKTRSLGCRVRNIVARAVERNAPRTPRI